jgi:nitroreductase
MNILDAIKKRRSIRYFHQKEIPEELIDKLTESLIWAPSAGNLQSRKFYFIRDEAVKIKVAEAALNQGFIAEAPLVIVGCTDSHVAGKYGERGVTLYSIQDVACSIMAMILVAFDNKLGTCWVGAFREEELTRILNLPMNLKPVVIIPVGYPSKNPSPPQRVSKKEAVEFI